MAEPCDESIQLLQRYCDDDSQAAEELFQRYVSRLTALVRVRMSPALGRRLDAEDVVQSVYRTFFRRAKVGEFELQRGGDLWKLLATISIKKLGKQIEHHLAAKRAVSSEANVSGLGDDLQATICSKHLLPDEEAILKEQIESLMVGLDEVQRQMIEMRLAGYMLEEIAEGSQRSERTVRRLLEKVKLKLESDVVNE